VEQVEEERKLMMIHGNEEVEGSRKIEDSREQKCQSSRQLVLYAGYLY